MIRHIVCFKLKPGESPEKAAEILLSMKGRVPQIIDIEAGTDLLHSARSCDVALSVLLENKEALAAYQNDPYHCETVKKHMHAAAESSVSADFEVDKN